MGGFPFCFQLQRSETHLFAAHVFRLRPPQKSPTTGSRGSPCEAGGLNELRRLACQICEGLRGGFVHIPRLLSVETGSPPFPSLASPKVAASMETTSTLPLSQGESSDPGLRESPFGFQLNVSLIFPYRQGNREFI